MSERGKGVVSGRGRGRGSSSSGPGAPGGGPATGRRSYRRSDGANGGSGLGAGGEDVSIESLVAQVGSIPSSHPITDAVYQALFQLDGRACAMLLKDLSKAGMQFRWGWKPQ